jgi:hypothetical protein
MPASSGACASARVRGGEPETVVRWELAAAGPGVTRLVFSQSGLAKAETGRVPTGWHVFLERLGAQARVPEFMGRFGELQGVYRSRYGL